MLTIDNNKCTGCGQCVPDCVFNSLKLVGKRAVLDGRCIQCGHCVAICPQGAVSIAEYDMQDVEALDAASFALEPVSLLRAIKFRRSIRRFTGQKVEREKLVSIIQAGRYTATGSNAQGCQFMVVQDELKTLREMVWRGVAPCLTESQELMPDWMKSLMSLASLRQANGIDFLFRNAPAVLYIAAESPIDAGLAAQNMELMAVAQGLGVMFNGFVARLSAMNAQVRAWLNVREGKPIAASMLLGYPNVQYQRSAPRKAADVVWR